MVRDFSWGETKRRTGLQFKKIIIRSSLMSTHLHQEIKRRKNLVFGLDKEVDLKNRRIKYMEKKERDQLNATNVELCMSLSRIMKERDQLNKANLELTIRMQGIMNENEILRREFRNQRRELEQQHKEIEKHEAQLDLKCKQLVVLREEVKDMCKRLEEKDYELDGLMNMNNTLIAKERISNHELQEARKVLIEGLDGFANIRSRPPVGIKRMGELNEKPFRHICITKFSTTEWETKSVELCSLWQYKIQDSGWYPYKNVTIDKELNVNNHSIKFILFYFCPLDKKLCVSKIPISLNYHRCGV
ncbi:hypothetical protein MKX03_025473 [Papaver bracteatum]|nr:hypothetical protein MKX03_025473 [Papaver bracteatum]